MAVAHFGFEPDAPKGTVAMWDGPLSEIPSGWMLCDGNNGTVDLLDEFVEGVVDDSLVGDSGGSNTVTLSTSQLPSHGHSGSTTDGVGNHHHTISGYDDFEPGSYGNGGGEGGAYSTTTNGSHTHNITSVGSAGSGASIDNRPKYYEVAFIQKV